MRASVEGTVVGRVTGYSVEARPGGKSTLVLVLESNDEDVLAMAQTTLDHTCLCHQSEGGRRVNSGTCPVHPLDESTDGRD